MQQTTSFPKLKIILVINIKIASAETKFKIAFSQVCRESSREDQYKGVDGETRGGGVEKEKQKLFKEPLNLICYLEMLNPWNYLPLTYSVVFRKKTLWISTKIMEYLFSYK